MNNNADRIFKWRFFTLEKAAFLSNSKVQTSVLELGVYFVFPLSQQQEQQEQEEEGPPPKIYQGKGFTLTGI